MGMFKSAAIISLFTLFSRITGLIRDIIIAAFYGAGPLTDAFWVAFRIPNLLRRLFAEGAFAQAFVPVLGKTKNDESPERVKILLDRVATLLTTVLLAITIIGIVFAPIIVSIMASGMRDASRSTEFNAAIYMTRVMFPYILCMSLVAFASGILNTWRKFAVPAFTPVLLNLSMIAACVFLIDRFEVSIYALSYGVMLGGLLQLSVQLFALWRIGVLPRISFNIKKAYQDSTVQHIMRQMLPAILGVSVAQLSILINTNIATWLTPGSVTWLSFADRLMEFPTALLGVALGTVLLPTLSKSFADNDKDNYRKLIDWGLKLILIFGLPAALGLAMLAEGLVATLFNYGSFSSHDVTQTKLAVFGYSVGLIGLLSVKVLAPGFYAQQDIRTPVRIAIVVLISTQILNVILVPIFSHAGLTLSIGIGATLNSLLLLLVLKKRGIYSSGVSWFKFLARITPALICMAAVLLVSNNYFDWLELAAQPMIRALILFSVVISAALAYFITLFLLGFRLRDFTHKPV